MEYIAYQKPLKGEKFGVVFGTFAPLHQGHIEIIMRAKKENDGVIVVCCGSGKGDKGSEVGLPLWKRYQYTRQFFKGDDLVAVYAIEDENTAEYRPENWTGWLNRFCAIEEVAIVGQGKELTWYMGEEAYKEDLEYYDYYDRRCVLLDRNINPISGTKIRKNPMKYWNQIALPFRKTFSLNVLVIGTASEGKTTLVKDLAKTFGTTHAHEWARDYLAKKGIADWEFGINEFLAFLTGQAQHIEDEMGSPGNNGVFFCDTDALVTEMYAWKYAQEKGCRLSESDYNVIRNAAEKIFETERWDAIFFLEPTEGFADDHVRFMEHAKLKERIEMSKHLFELLKSLNGSHNIVTLGGGYMDRYSAISDFIKRRLQDAEMAD